MPDLDYVAIGEAAAKIALQMHDLGYRQRLDGLGKAVLELADKSVPALIKRIVELEGERARHVGLPLKTPDWMEAERIKWHDDGPPPEEDPLEQLQCANCGRVLTGDDHEETIYTRVRTVVGKDNAGPIFKWGNAPMCSICWMAQEPGLVPVRVLRRKLLEAE